MRLILIRVIFGKVMSRTMPLSSLQLHDKARIIAFTSGCDQQFRRQLISMGVLPNCEITLARIAPLRDPIEIKVRDYRLLIRLADARFIQVERL